MDMVVSNLPIGITEEELKSVFEKYGTVTYVIVRSNNFAGTGRDYGIIEMPNDAEVREAIGSLDGTDIKGHLVDVHKPRPRKGDRRRKSLNWKSEERRSGEDRRKFKDPVIRILVSGMEDEK